MTPKSFCYAYPRPSVTADCVVFAHHEGKLHVLLIRRGHDPYAGCWAFPGGFMDIDETIEACALRELQEETGITATTAQQFHTYSALDRDPRGRTLSVAFIVEVAMQPVQGSDDAAEARWFPVDSVPPLAFDHEEMLAQALATYRSSKCCG